MELLTTQLYWTMVLSGVGDGALSQVLRRRNPSPSGWRLSGSFLEGAGNHRGNLFDAPADHVAAQADLDQPEKA